MDELENDIKNDPSTEIEAGLDEGEENEAKVYEASFHIVPTLAPEDAKAEFESIKKMIIKEGGTHISEGEPVLRSLAYTLSKTVKAVKSNYDKAYFGWVKFETTPVHILNIKKALDEIPTVIRHLLIVTVKENTMVSKAEESEISENGEKEEGSTPVATIEDLDKTIDELVV